VRVNGEQVGAGSINASEYECGTYVALVPAARHTNTLSILALSQPPENALEEPLFEHGHRSDNTGLAAG